MVMSFVKKFMFVFFFGIALPGNAFMMQGGDDDEFRLRQEAAELKRRHEAFQQLSEEEQQAQLEQAQKAHAEKLAARKKKMDERKALMAQRKQEEAAQRDREDEQLKRQRLENAGEGTSGVAASSAADADSVGSSGAGVMEVDAELLPQIEQKETLVCLSCYDEEATEGLITLSCSAQHVVHKNCLRQWIGEGNPSCPACRTVMSPVFLQQHDLLVNVPAWLARVKEDAILGTESFFNNCEDILTTVIAYCASDDLRVSQPALSLISSIVTGVFEDEAEEREPYWAKLTSTHVHDLLTILLGLVVDRTALHSYLPITLVIILNLACQPERFPALSGVLKDIFGSENEGAEPAIARCIELAAFMPALIRDYAGAEVMEDRLMQQVVEPARRHADTWLKTVRGQLERRELSDAALLERDRTILEACIAAQGSDQSAFARELIDRAWRSGEVPVDPSLLLRLVRRFIGGVPTDMATGGWVGALLKGLLSGEGHIKFENEQMRRAWGEQIWGIYALESSNHSETDDERRAMLFAILQFMYPAAFAILDKASVTSDFVKNLDILFAVECERTAEFLSSFYTTFSRCAGCLVSSLLSEAESNWDAFCAEESFASRVQGLLYMAAYSGPLSAPLTKLIEVIATSRCLDPYLPLIAEIIANGGKLPPSLFDHIDCEQLLVHAGAMPYFHLRAGQEQEPMPRGVMEFLCALPLNCWPQAGKEAYAELLRSMPARRASHSISFWDRVYAYWLHYLPDEREKAEFAERFASRHVSVGTLSGLPGGSALIVRSFIECLEKYSASAPQDAARLKSLWEWVQFIVGSTDPKNNSLKQALIRALVAAREHLLRTDQGVEVLKFVLYDMTTEQRLTCLEGVNAINQPCCSAEVFARNCASCGTNSLEDLSIRIRFLRAAARHFSRLQPSTVFSLSCETINLMDEDFAQLPLEELGVALLGVLLARFSYSAGPDVGQFRLGCEILERVARHEQGVVRCALGLILTDLASNFSWRFSAFDRLEVAREREECEILLIEILTNHLMAFDEFTQEEAGAIKMLEDEAIPHLSARGQVDLAAALRESLPVIKSKGRIPRPVGKSRRCGDSCSIQ